MHLDKRLLNRARSAWPALGLTIGLGWLAGLALVGQAFFLSRVISRVFLGGASPAQVTPLLLAIAILSLGRAGLRWAAQVTAQRLAGRVKRELRARLTAHLLRLGPAFVQGERSGELSNTLTEGIEKLDAYLGRYLPQLALAALIPLSILLIVFPLDFTSGLVLLLTAPLIPIFMNLIGATADQLTRQQWTSLSRMSAHFLDTLQGLTTLKLLGRSREQADQIARTGDRFREITMRVLRVAFLSALVLEMVATISTALVAVEVGLRLLYGRFAFEQALFILILAPEFYLPLRLLGTHFHDGMTGVAAANRIFELLSQAPPVPQAAPMIYCPAAAPAIRLEDVHYAYGERPALNGVSPAIDPGQRVALVGPSGAGKSTLMALLLRFIEPDRGRIIVDGRPLAGLDPAAWRQGVAWLSQDPYLFYGTVAENIRLARPEASPAQLREAVRLASADAFIEALPQGYDTMIGERGLRLSGGQAQRLALARAFLKDAPLLLLDEATANLDPAHESQIQAALARLLPGRTTLMIAHRLPTIQAADQIIVMEGGRIVERGDHAGLLARRGLYHRLVAAYQGADDA